VVARVRVEHLFLFEATEVETRDRQLRLPARPLGDGHVAVARLRADALARADEDEVFRVTEDHVEDGAVAKLCAGVVRIPSLARTQNEVATAFVVQRAVALIFNR